MYIGQAKVKLFHDSSCTKELKKNISGKYLTDVRVISGQPTHTLTKRIYAKNLGTHKAYNVYYFVKDMEGSKDDTPTTDLPINADDVLN